MPNFFYGGCNVTQCVLVAGYSPALFPIIHAIIQQPQAGTIVSMATG